MMRSLWSGLLAGLVTLAGAASGFADEPPTRPVKPARTNAVLIGVGQFADKQIKPRPSAEADAQALYDLFTNKDYVDVGRVQLLLSSSDAARHAELATHDNILKAIHDAVTHSVKGDTLILAFIGQGASTGDRTTCFFGTDASFKDRTKTAVSGKDLEKELSELKPGVRVVGLVDINFKGFDPGKETVLDPNLGEFVTVLMGLKQRNERDEEGDLPAGRVVYLSSRKAGSTLTLDKLGLFTHVVLDALKGAADKEGYGPDGLVTVDELTTYLEKQVPEKARTIAKNEDNKEQIPLAVAGPVTHFPITRNPALTAQVKKHLDKLAELASAGKVNHEVAAEGQRLLARMPKLKAQQNLRKEYVRLVDGDQTVEQFNAARATILASLVLKPEDAESYARKVMEGITQVRREYVKELNQGDMVGWAIRGLYRRLEEPMPADLKNQLGDLKELGRARLLQVLADARTRLGIREDLDKNQDVDDTLDAMLKPPHVDVHTIYIDHKSLIRFRIETQGRFNGIGIQIRRDIVHDALLVATPILGSPAYKAGLKTGDLITEIRTRTIGKDGQLSEDETTVSTKGMETEEAVKLILGHPGVPVTLTIVREGVKEPLKVRIVRGLVETETVLGYKRNADDSWDYYLDPKSKIAYIRLTQFGPRSAAQMEQVVDQLQEKGVKGLVLDLRNDPGGLLTAAVRITDLFIDDGVIVSIRPRNAEEEQQYSGKHEGSHLAFPMVVLVNSMSASGSEIVAAALQDHRRAVIIGERSYGKGSVQNIVPFPPTEAQIKMTTATFWRPSGKNLNRASTSGSEAEDWGVRPDPGFLVKLSTKERTELNKWLLDLEVIPRRDLPAKEPKKEFHDKQLDAAMTYLREQIRMAQAGPKKEPR